MVSKGEEKTTVPKVVGMEKDKAVKALEDAKLKVEIVEETSKTVKEGYVIISRNCRYRLLLQVIQ
ncbi:MAG: PASTA domain-containing protein [Clostridia bacterium]